MAQNAVQQVTVILATFSPRQSEVIAHLHRLGKVAKSHPEVCILNTVIDTIFHSEKGTIDLANVTTAIALIFWKFNI